MYIDENFKINYNFFPGNGIILLCFLAPIAPGQILGTHEFILSCKEQKDNTVH